MAAGPGQDLVLVQFEYEYTTRDGGLVSIKPNERFLLVSRTNEHWWHVRRDESTKPFYVPAKYVKELPSEAPFPVKGEPPEGRRTPEPLGKPAESADQRASDVTIRVCPPANCCKKPEVRMSTFGVHYEFPDELCLRADSLAAQHVDDSDSRALSSVAKGHSQHTKRYSLTASVQLGSCTVLDDVPNPPQKPRVPSFSPPDPARKPTQAKRVDPPVIKGAEQKTVKPAERPEEQSDSAESFENVYETIEDIQDKTSKRPPGSAPGSSQPPLSTPALLLPPTPDPSPALDAVPLPSPVPSPVPRPSSAVLFTPDPPRPPAQAESSCPSNAVYVNVAELRESIQQSSPPSSASSLLGAASLDLEGWEIHTDQDSGQKYYYYPATGQTTWDPPFGCPADQELSPEPLSSPSPTQSPLLSPTDTDWEQLFDDSSGCHYFYNHVSGETSWEPPEGYSSASCMNPQDMQQPVLPEDDYPAGGPDEPGMPLSFPKQYTYSHVKPTAIPRVSPDASAPLGWTCSVDPDGTWVFTNNITHEQWIKSLDERGQTYYYLKDGSKSQWHLPEVPVPSGKQRVGNGLNQEGVSALRSWRNTMGPAQFSTSQEDLHKFLSAQRRYISNCGSGTSSSGNSPELQHHPDRFRHRRNPSDQSCESQHHSVLEKAGILNKTKVCENGKKVRKNWSQSWTVLHGGVLTFHKDPKSAPAGSSNKTNQIVPEFTVELRGATICWASKDKSSKKNVLELKTRTGAEFLMQYDTDSIINDWHKVIADTIRQLDQPCEEEDGEPNRRGSTKPGTLGSDAEQKKVRTKLLKFLQKRPTLQSVKEKGYIRDSMFGCALGTLCAMERTTIPSFVEKCISAVERRGVDIDGIYRVSGNLAVIQRLRYKADHEELDLEDGQWEDVHVITGALKLFFRELPEPLFPYSYFNNFIAAIKISDYNQKVSYMRDLVKSLPHPNHDTMKLLFRHLRRVIEQGEENRMTVQNVAIVFGPTLLRPETESANITMHMVFQNQIVELILNEYEQIFYED
ncbi:rho GTPase-activating protein 27 isoform X1 [Arapaima gigas]